MSRRRPPGSPKPPRRSTGDYPVGYCRPPAEHQFKPGQSGNRKGRPKGSKEKPSVVDELNAVLAERVPLRSSRGQETVTFGKAFFWTLLQDAIKGDRNARKLALALLQPQLALAATQQQQPGEVETEENTAQDEELLKDYLRRHRRDEDDAKP